MGIESFIKSMCVQTAVYWGAPQADGFGTMLYVDPVEIKVRWDIKQKLVIDSKGREVMSDTEILSPEDLVTEGVLYLGELNELSSDPTIQPTDLNGVELYEIAARTKVSMPKSKTQFVRSYSLTKKR